MACSRGISRETLKNELECSERTVDRIVDDINNALSADLEIVKAPNNNNEICYQLVSHKEENVPGFSFEEVRYLATCRDLAAPYLPEAVIGRINRSLVNLALHLEEGQRRSVSGAPITFANKGYIDYGPHAETIKTLNEAIANRRVCSLCYLPMNERTAKSYRYAPGRIVAMNGVFYVQGHYLDEGSLLPGHFITFLLHRITQITPGEEYFHFNAFEDTSRAFGLKWHEPMRRQIHVAADAADYVRDRIWSADQTIEEQDDGGIILSVTTTSEKELQAWVWSFGGLAEIITPSSNEESQGQDTTASPAPLAADPRVLQD
ncbi:hypothetical protein Rru_A2452 [Rhodospirillum rubrum ATCC 11170]|uniref:Uncharacterized protein n=2 Tax=Rhodospirillum rubrum TaxID=1085 RepID=Q2RRJ3_RHORT|nr:hypothetical protein Rru_A2452 [Rhodospirillum rubrum ATCC 11170]MBK5954892.1 WYL domain-containing protein [Rhodospirillum rubrum]HCF18772.1 WYL domain-containing protein [Rhodospirillum rubrum]